MLFVVRGKSSDHHERSLRIEAATAREAEAAAFSRGIFVIEVTPFARPARRVLRLTKLVSALRRAWSTPVPPLRCFGRPITGTQGLILVLLGATTWAVDLHNLHLM